MSVEHKHVHCTDNTRGVDKLLQHYANVNAAVLTEFRANPAALVQRLWTVYLNMDTTCACSMGTVEPAMVLSHSTKCVQCTQLERIAVLGVDLINTPFKLSCGSRAGQYLVVSQTLHAHPQIQLQADYQYSAEYITEYYNKLSVCDGSLKFKQYCTSDTLTHGYLMSNIAQSLSANTVHMHSAFVCCSTGYTVCSNDPGLVEYTEAAGASSTWASQCLVQLVHTFGTLIAHNFTHNNVSTHSLQFSGTPWTSGKLRHPWTLKIGDFNHACIDYAGCRLYNYNTYSEMHIGELPIIHTIESKLVDVPNTGSWTAYRFNYETAKKILHLRRLGINLYSTSLDLYCYLIVCCSNDAFRSAVTSDPKLMQLWNSIWSPSELPILYARLDKLSDVPNVDVLQCLQTLSGLNLRCDLYHHLSQQLL